MKEPSQTWRGAAGYSTPYKFTSKERDEHTGLDYFGARYYDPAIGRFISPDPLSSLAPGWTPYRYGFNNPIIYTDPTGMFESKDEAKQYAKDNGIKTGWFRDNKIAKQSDGTYAITNNGKIEHYFGGHSSDGGTVTAKRKYEKYSFSNSETMRHLKTFGSNLPKYMQDGGDAVAVAGYGLTVSVVGAEAGVPMAAIGSTVSAIGSGLELIQNLSNKNYNKAGQNAGFLTAGVVTNILLDKALPGPTPNFDFDKVLMDASRYDLSKEILKQNASLKLTGLDRLINIFREKSDSKKP